MNNQPVILFDGVCNLCNGAVQYIIRHDREEKFSFASLQSEAGQRLLKQYDLPQQHFDTFVLIDHDKAWTRSTAALKVTRQLNGPVKLLFGFIIVPRFIRDWIYAFIAANRYKWFGKQESCMLPTPSLQKRFLND
ncbi:MAG: thiol-disulfide oxidoreductase DCC family protein [Ferruginibacter sp.]